MHHTDRCGSPPDQVALERAVAAAPAEAGLRFHLAQQLMLAGQPTTALSHLATLMAFTIVKKGAGPDGFGAPALQSLRSWAINEIRVVPLERRN